MNYRLFLLHGDSKYFDVLERTLYNGLISGVSLDGGKFFYPNPLSCDGKYHFNADHTITRQPWFGCACCPSNISRVHSFFAGICVCRERQSGVRQPFLVQPCRAEVE